MKKLKHSYLPLIMRIFANSLLVVTAIAILTGYYLCPINCIFKIPCPGCGMTRACKAALRFDFKAAFQFNCLFPIPFALAFYHLFRRYIRIGKVGEIILFSASGAALVIRWIIIMII